MKGKLEENPRSTPPVKPPYDKAPDPKTSIKK